MATIYVNSNTGNNANNGSTWALAKASVGGVDGAASIEAAGDDIVIASDHSESFAASTTIALAGTSTAPNRLVCVNATGSPEPPTEATTGAVIATTGASNISFSPSHHDHESHIEGIRIRVGDSTNAATISFNAGGRANYSIKNCHLECAGNAASSRINLYGGNNASARFVAENMWVRFANASSFVTFSNSQLSWRGGGLESGGTSPTTLFGSAINTNSTGDISGLDLTAGASTMNIFAVGASNPSFWAVIRNSKLPASWTGGLVTTAEGSGSYRVEMHNCTSGATVYGLWVASKAGTIRDEQVVKRTGGAGESHKFTTGALSTAEMPLEGVEVVALNETTGSAITVTVEVVTDNVTLTNGECWLEVQYLSSDGKSTFINDGKANTLGTTANQTSSTVDWTTTGLTTPVKQKLEVTFTPATAGFIHAVVKVGKPSTTVYVDPALTVT